MLKDYNNEQNLNNPTLGKSKSVESNDSGIWDEFRSGNESAFIHIYQNYFDKLYNYGLRITKDEDLVKDSIQDLFIELRKKRSQLGKTDSIKFYLFKCIKRKIIKEEGKWYSKLEKLDYTHYFHFDFSHEQYIIDRQIDEEKQVRLREAIEKLSPRKKEIIYYFYHEGLSYLQIQELMGLDNIKSARNLIYKAIDFLKNAMLNIKQM